MSEPHDQLEHFEEFDEFDNEFQEESPKPQGAKERLAHLWRNNPAFKFGVIGGSVAVLAVGAYAMMGNNKPITPGADQARVGTAETVKGTVGADTTPEYRNLLQNDNQQRAKDALQNGQSAIPTPVGNVATTTAPKEQPVDPLAMWRQAEQQQSPKPPPTAMLQQGAPNNNQAQQQQQDTNQRTQAMTTQINSLLQAWQPTDATVVSFTAQNQTNANNTNPNNTATNTTNTGNNTGTNTTNTTPKPTAKVIVPAGDIVYASMITEANSDVPGPILAQILSGPLKGGRLIGSFQVSEDYLVLSFRTLSIHGHSYAVDAIALDPNTTLGGVATETDQRYFSRLILPAAAAFVSQFGQAISQAGTTTSISNGTVVVTQPSVDTRQALYGGAGQAASQVSQFVSAAGNQVKPLVRVASNTPVGIFFTSPVTDKPQETQQ